MVRARGRNTKPTDPIFPDADGLPYRPSSAELLPKDLERMRKAVEAITLDRSTGDVIRMPLKRVQNAPTTEFSEVQTVGLPGDRPASFPRAAFPAGAGDAKSRNLLSRFRELNPGPTVYETVALPLS
jgi:hypothetical protein